MKRTRWTFGSMAMLLALGIGLAGSRCEAQESLEQYAQSALRDVRATIVVEQKNDAALREIDEDAPKGYNIKRTQVSLKEPDKVRVEGKYGLLGVMYVINGDRKMRTLPGLRVRKVKNIANRPGERYTALDLGTLTPGLVAQLESKFVRYETRGSKKLAVFRVTFKGEPGGGRPNLLFVDPTTRTVVERHVLFRTREQVKRRIVYLNPMRYTDNVWLPTRVEVYSPTGKLAAVTRAEEVQVNSGLPDSLFQF